MYQSAQHNKPSLSEPPKVNRENKAADIQRKNACSTKMCVNAINGDIAGAPFSLRRSIYWPNQCFDKTTDRPAKIP
ncbi:MAG: hypothetical protein ACJAUP_002642 [Cellvibrionaceae bacterium]|jgi:hypothetical protein